MIADIETVVALTAVAGIILVAAGVTAPVWATCLIAGGTAIVLISAIFFGLAKLANL